MCELEQCGSGSDAERARREVEHRGVSAGREVLPQLQYPGIADEHGGEISEAQPQRKGCKDEDRRTEIGDEVLDSTIQAGANHLVGRQPRQDRQQNETGWGGETEESVHRLSSSRQCWACGAASTSGPLPAPAQ